MALVVAGEDATTRDSSSRFCDDADDFSVIVTTSDAGLVPDTPVERD